MIRSTDLDDFDRLRLEEQLARDDGPDCARGLRNGAALILFGAALTVLCWLSFR